MTSAPIWEMTKITDCLILKTMMLGLPNCIPFLLLRILIHVCYYIIFIFTAALHLFYRISAIGNALHTRITHVTWGPYDDPPVCGSTAEVKSLVTYAVYEFFIDSEKRVTCRDKTQKHALYFNTFFNLNSCSNVKIVII